MAETRASEPASLEALVESGDLALEVLHPGGLALTRELAEMCHAEPGRPLLDVASGTGESACFLAGTFRCPVTGVDHAPAMIERATQKAGARNLDITFLQGDAHHLPFPAESFDVVLSECTTCALDKAAAIGEMVRVARPGGYVGISDLYWTTDAPPEARARLAEIEGERPEDLAGWERLFRDSGLEEVRVRDHRDAMARSSRETRAQLGVRGYLRLLRRIWRRWGWAGLRRIMASEKLFAGRYLGYALIVGRKP